MSAVHELKKRALEDLNRATDSRSLEEVRVAYVGRKGELTALLKSLKDLPLEERRELGSEANTVRNELEEAFDARSRELARDAREVTKHIDITKPGTRMHRGFLHPLTKIDEEVRRIFVSMNFSVVEGPEIETERNNFDALNIPANHPARDLWDTFWLKANAERTRTDDTKKTYKPTNLQTEKLLLRTHTSPMQIRYMESHNPPFQIIVPGRVFRYEATDASHEFNFYQVEGLMVGPDITLANLKYVVEEFFKKLFGESAGRRIEFRFRPSYFPFVEPGLEVDIKLPGGAWLEVMGAGMVHRNVFNAVRYNPNEVQGFAFGVGLDRLAMIKYKVPDIRLFYSGDTRFIRQL